VERLPALKLASPRRLKADLIVVPCFEGEPPEKGRLPAALASVVARLAARDGWRGEPKQIAEAAAGGGAAVRLLGIGKRRDLDARTLRLAIVAAVESGRRAGAASLALVVPEHPRTAGEAGAELVAREALLAAYRFERFRSERKPRAPRQIQLLPAPAEEAAYRRALGTAAIVAAAAAYVRDIDNTPPNEATPEWMAEQAARLARRHRMRITVLGPRELRRRGMGGVLAVGGGSANPPRLVRLEWGRGGPAVALVGKGVTFDTGGISIKPAQGMEEMTYDKSGACAVLGVMRAAAELDLPVRLRGYLPLAENMPSGAAYRPGDILRCYNGKTVEITNTDAEGRLILADALAWAAEEEPEAILEYSTLTGACVVALGLTGAGLFTPDDDLAAGLLAAAEASGERLWRLPLWSEFDEEMKGEHADLKNSAGRWGGASTAAAFLSNFVGGVKRWAHFDIAGPAYVGTDGKGPKGATGYGVATTIAWLRQARQPKTQRVR
jgi:leucyl aminopeptidase